VSLPAAPKGTLAGPGATARSTPGADASAASPATLWDLRARVRRFLTSRLPRTDTQLLTQGNIYIVPTRAGWMFAATLVVLLLASVNYQLNLGYVLTFLLAGSGIVSMHITHGTLRGLTLHLRPVAPAFAGGPAVLDIVMTSPSSARFGIGLRLVDAPASTLAWTNVPAGGQATSHVSYVPTVRGRVDVPTLSAETRFPLGLFRAWTVWRPLAQVLVYPRAEPDAPALPAARPSAGATARARRSDGGEVEGVRAYRRGDPPKLIAWKKAAQALETGAELVSRDTSTSARHELWLDWSACAPLGAEARLSRLAAWTLAADRADADFGLRLPGLEIAPGDGDAQRTRCLESLALWHS